MIKLNQKGQNDVVNNYKVLALELLKKSEVEFKKEEPDAQLFMVFQCLQGLIAYQSEEIKECDNRHKQCGKTHRILIFAVALSLIIGIWGDKALATAIEIIKAIK
jgi:hypothetical protein